jgi:2,5-diamino-6-(ribosylamino)-4(3H)-pyrimidinone 5'-phosphate reductase
MTDPHPFGKEDGDAAAILASRACFVTMPSMKRPRISMNFAISSDGKITSAARRPSGWTSREDHARLLELRKSADALMVGRGTLEADNMTMTVPGQERQPLRCVVSRSGNFRTDHPLFHTPAGPIHLLATGSSPDFTLPGASVHRCSLTEFLDLLARQHHVAQLHCEGGGELAQTLAALGMIDELHLTLGGHTLFGGALAPTVTGIPGSFLPDSMRLTLSHFEPRPDLGECFLTYTRRA